MTATVEIEEECNSQMREPGSRSANAWGETKIER
jgi:hypothetical protein